MSEHGARGFLATVARYAETAFTVISAGPSRYARTGLGPQYSSPAEFLIITLIINGLASLGLHTAVASAVDESKTAEHVSNLSLAALGSIAIVVVWAFAAAWAARLSGRRIPHPVLWRVSCYTTAFALLVIPLTVIWIGSIEAIFPGAEVDDYVRYLPPAFLVGIFSIVAFIRGAVQGFDGRRVRFTVLFLALAPIVPALARALPTIPGVGGFISEHARPSINAVGGQTADSLTIRSQRSHVEGFSRFAQVEERDRVQLSIDVQNLSGVTAHNVDVRIEGPFLRGPQEYVFFSIATCNGCGREDVGRAEMLWRSSHALAVRRLTAVMYRDFDYKKPLALPNGQTVDSLFSDVGLMLGDVRSGSEERLQIVVDITCDPNAVSDNDYAGPTVDYPDAAPVAPKVTVDHPPSAAGIPPPPNRKK